MTTNPDHKPRWRWTQADSQIIAFIPVIVVLYLVAVQFAGKAA